MKRQLLSGLLALVLVMTGCSGAGSSAGTKEAETTQETTQEAESDGVRPLFKLQSHSRMEEKDDTVIASGSYDTVSLSESSHWSREQHDRREV